MNKIISIVIGALAFVAIFQAIELTSLATANQNNQFSGDSHMSCMTGQMSLEQMDKNNDGVCDLCGMPVSECNAMMGENNGMMGSSMHGMMGQGMSCHM